MGWLGAVWWCGGVTAPNLLSKKMKPNRVAMSVKLIEHKCLKPKCLNKNCLVHKIASKTRLRCLGRI